MTDRQPTKPGRVSLTDEQTNVTKYYTIEMADEPTDVGTPPIKVNLFSDATAAKYPAGTDTVDKALAAAMDAINAGVKIETLLSVTLPIVSTTTLTYNLSDSVWNYNAVIIEIRNLVGTSNFWMNVAINNDCTSSHMSVPASTTSYTPASCNAVIYPDSDSMWNGYYSYCAQSSSSTSKTITGITGNVSVSDASKISIKAASSPYSGNAGATLKVRGVKF